MQLRFVDSLLQVEASYQTSPQSGTDTLFFLLNPGIDLQGIGAPGLQSHETVQRAGRPFPFRALLFDPARRPGEEISIEFNYTIDLRSQNHLASRWIELSVDKMWFPIRDDLDNPFTYEVSVEGLPSGYTLLTHADTEVSSREGTLWLKRGKPWYEVLLLAGENLRAWDGGDGIRFWASREVPDSLLLSMHRKVAGSIAHLNRVMGMADPIGAFTVVLRNTPRQELGYQFNRGPMIITGPDFDDYGNLAHEIAHYWWSGADFIREPWMNESFANYGMYSVMREFDPGGFAGLLEKNRARAAGAIPVAGAGLFAENAFDSYYHKGALLLMDLEQRIGREPMQALLSECIRNHVRSTAEFLHELERQAGAETRQYFEGLLKS